MFKRILALSAVTALAFTGCVSNQSGSDSAFDDLESADAQAAPADQPVVADNSQPAQQSAQAEDGFSDFDKQDSPPPAQVAEQSPPPADQAADPFTDADLQDQGTQKAEAQTPMDEELSLDDKPAPAQPQDQAAILPPEPVAPQEPIMAPEPLVQTPRKPVEITGLKYKANETGGTVLIEASGPISYTTRSNPDLKQFIVEVSNSKLPDRLKRPLNTKDFNGGIGSIDAYQTTGSKTSRFVVQLREGAAEPFIQVEGNTLLVVSSDPNSQAFAPTGSSLKGNESGKPGSGKPGEEITSADPIADADLNINLNDSRILTSQSLVDFLSGNSKFYGKKISVEFNKTPVVQAIRFFMEETGINMIIDKDVGGEVTMKLRQVPWDQAFTTMLRMSDLIYQRQGSILRIATVAKLQKEEDDATKLVAAKRMTQPLKVRNFFMNFLTTKDAMASIKDLLKENGKDSPTLKMVEDPKNGKIIVQDVEENLILIDKIIKNLDMPTKQVLIEGKIVEASERFTRTVGVNWGLNSISSGNNNASIQIANGVAGGNLFANLTIGQLPVLGDLNAVLGLAELEQSVKVVSSPRIMTITGEPANMTVESSITTQNSTATASGTGTLVTTNYSNVKLPVKLEVTPKVTPDNFISMKLSVNRTVGTVGPTGVANTEDRKFDTNILVRDGQTAAIGGLYQTDNGEGENGVPFLKDIPFLGVLFKNKTTTKQKTELLVFITPRVVTQEFQSGSTETVGSAADANEPKL